MQKSITTTTTTTLYQILNSGGGSKSGGSGSSSSSSGGSLLSLLVNHTTYTSTSTAAIDLVEDGPNWNHPLLGLLLITMTIITIFGNTLVICAVIRERCLKSVTYYFIVSLAVADLIVGLFVMPFNSLNKMTNNFWFFGDVWCDIWHSMDVFASTASINSLLIIALDRHSAISDPINYHTTWLTRYWVVFVALIWIGSACISFPAIAYWRAVTKEYLLNTCVFPDDIYYLVFSSLVSFYIPLVIMVVVYVRIYRAATRQMYALKTGQKVNVKAADGTQLTLRIHRGGYHAVDNANTNTNAAPTSNADNNAHHNHNESAAAAKRKSLVHTDSYHAHVPISDRYKKRNSEEKESNNQVQNTTAILSAVKDHRKTSTGSAAVAQLLNLTKQPSLTSLLDLGIICGPLGSDTNGLDNNNSLSSPTSRAVRPRLKAAATSEEKSSSLDKKDEDEEADRNNRGEIILEPLSSSSPSDSLAPSSPPPTSPPPPLTITATSNEGQHGVTTTNETESSTTTTSMLKAPKLARNEASISSLSSFFMNNQLKTLNFLYYPSLITKSKWSSKSSHCEAKSDVNSVDNRVSKDEVSSGSKKSSPTSSSSEPQSMRMRRQPPQHQATITSAPLSETHEARQRGAGGKIMEKANSEERENAGRLGGGRAGALDLLSEYSQVKSSESIDEAVMQEKLAAYLALNKMKRGGGAGADAADETCDGASPNIGRSIRTKIIDSIKRRLSLPNENGPLYNVGIGDKNTTNGEERNATGTQEKSPSNKNQVGKLVLTPMEKEKLRRQLEYYHKHYMEHTMQLRRQQQQQQQDSAGSPTPNTPDWSTTNIEHKRRLFRFGQASKAKLRSLIMKRDGTMSINNNAPVSRNSSAYSSAYSFNSASFKQRGNGSIHHEHRSPHYASGAANAAAAASVRRKCSGATTMSAAAAIAIAKAKNTTCHSASKKTNSIASKVKGLTLAKKLSKFSREQKAAKTLGIVMGVFILCWLPFFIYNVITGIFKANLSKSHEFIYSIFTWFGYMNSGCNPIIYAFSSRDFRRAFTKILCPARFWRKKTKLIGSSTGFHRLNHSYTEASTLSRQQTKLRHQAVATTCPTCQTYENLILAKMNAKQQDGSKKTTTTTTTTTTAVSKVDSEPIEKKSSPPQNKMLPQLPPSPPQPQSPTPSVKASPLTPTIDLSLPEAIKTSPASLEYTFIKCKISNQPQEFVTRENEIKNQQQQQHEFELLKFRLIRLDNNNNVINNDNNNNNNMSCSTTDQVNNTTTRVRTPPPALQSPSQPSLTIIRDLATSKQQQAFIMSKAATANATSGSPTDVSPTIPGVGLKLPILKLAENQQPSGSFSSSILVTGGLHRRHNNSSLYTLARNLRRRIHSMFLVKRSSASSHNHQLQLKPTRFRYVNAHHTSTVRRMSAGSVLSGLSLNLATSTASPNKSLNTICQQKQLTLSSGKLNQLQQQQQQQQAQQPFGGRTSSRSPSISSSSVTPSSIIIKQTSSSSRKSTNTTPVAVGVNSSTTPSNMIVGSTTIAVGTRFRFKPIGGNAGTSHNNNMVCGDMRRAEFYSNYYDWRESRDDVVVVANGGTNELQSAASVNAAANRVEDDFYDDEDYFNTINKNVMKKRFETNAGHAHSHSHSAALKTNMS